MVEIKISRGTSGGVHAACKVQKIPGTRLGISSIYFLFRNFPQRDTKYTLLLIDAPAIPDKNREYGLN